MTFRDCMRRYFRSHAELAAPFRDADGPVRRKAGLSLISLEIRNERCKLHQRYVDGGFESDRAYGAALASTVSAFSRSKILRAFEGGSRPSTERLALAEAAFERFGAKVAAEPTAFGIDNVMALLVVAKAGEETSAIKSMPLYESVERICK